tara:strand:- start:17 stop:1012 length:996 start_codon:yes stop_codon:yes gene_type:complete
MNYLNNPIIITTYDTFSSEKFIKITDGLDIPILIICDEAHAAGSLKRSRGLKKNYLYRLALTATPKRWLDDLGTDLIYSYFDKTVFEFPLKEAIGRFLTPYNYFPHLVNLNQNEKNEYKSFGRKIAMLYSKTDFKSKEYLNLLLIKRSKIVINAEEKLDKLDEILNSTEKLENCLIFCSDKQLELVKDKLRVRAIKYRQFTNKENLEERTKIRKDFDEGLCDVLVAIKCLDEGVNIPSIKTAIILASSSNPKEYIQRRGRVLRRDQGKTKAIIHDFIIVPMDNNEINPDSYDVERKILAKELKRYEDFSDSSLNPLHSLGIINEFKQLYNL